MKPDDIREEILEGAPFRLELFGSEWIGVLDPTGLEVRGRTAAEVFLKIADILSQPVAPGCQ